MTLDQLLESPALDLLLGLERDGFQVEGTEAGTIQIAPADRLEPDRLATIKHRKAELLALVRLCDDGVQDRLVAFGTQLAEALPPRVPAFVFREGVPAGAGICCSCGDALRPPERRTVTCTRTDGASIQVELGERHGRCWRCLFAMRATVGAALPVLDRNGSDPSETVTNGVTTVAEAPRATSLFPATHGRDGIANVDPPEDSTTKGQRRNQ